MRFATPQTLSPGIEMPLFAVPGRGEPKLSAKWLGSSELSKRTEAWEHLSQNSLRGNATFEPNFLIPALNHLAGEDVRVLVVMDENASDDRKIIGLVPLRLKRLYRLPFKAAEVWKHDQCFDTTPLLHKDFAAPAWRVIVKQLVDDGFQILSLDTTSAEPELNELFRDSEKHLGLVRFQRDCFHRAAFTPKLPLEEYVRTHTSKSIRKNTRRMIRRLEDMGDVTWETSDTGSDYGELTREFLRIEASGWKGREKTALASNEDTRSFYEDLIRLSAASGKARFLSLKLDGRRIAMLSDIESNGVVYSYKTAYDDAFAKFSPGQQVELKNLEFLYRDGIEFGDSCTTTDNSTINKIWGQEIQFQSLIYSLQPGMSRAAVQMMPKLQSWVHTIRKIRTKGN